MRSNHWTGSRVLPLAWSLKRQREQRMQALVASQLPIRGADDAPIIELQRQHPAIREAKAETGAIHRCVARLTRQRVVARQVAVVEERKRRAMVAPPGTAAHRFGV